MQKWEYCKLSSPTGYTPSLTFYKPGGAQGYEIKRDKSKGDRDDYAAASRTIGTLGVDGWELVSYAMTGTPPYESIWVFKRPLP